MSRPHVLPAMVEVPESLRTALLGRYDLQRELGRGGMAAVFAARDLRYPRLVAIKVLNVDLAAAVGRARFLREIEIAARLNHPHILPLLDSGDAGGFIYYVMPCVIGESLKERIEREKQLPVQDAIAIAREVAAGLEHAHREGIVHRDVKPGNILLSGGSAVVSDFGIARAIRHSATDDTLTDVNLAIGTPPYMSPEQWTGTRELDARSDVYSLGCVVYEMLVGTPPFTGTTTEAIAARVASDPVPPIRTVRPRVSTGIEQVILRALEKVPADRFATVAEFAEALAAAPQQDTGPVPVPPPTPTWRWVVAAAGGIAMAVAGAFIVPRAWDRLTEAPDTTLYAVLPVEYQPGTSRSHEDQSLHDAFSRWNGITLVDPFQVRDAIDRRAGENISPIEALRVARSVRAGRYVRVEVSSTGDSIRIRGFVYDATRRGIALRSAGITLPARRVNLERALAPLADSLLFRGTEPPPQREVVVGTASYPARQAFARGHRAIEEWDLAAADTAFAQATTHDPRYAQAHLWLAQVRAWSVAPPEVRRSTAPWRSAAERAKAGSDRLTPRERVMADALVAAARGEFEHACARWREVSITDSLDFVAWYGVGSCLASDDAVVPDRRSPSGWRFRTSYNEAMLAYQRAYQLLPSVHRALRAGSYQSVRALLHTRSNMLRRGRGVPPDSSRYVAYPEWQGDSLAFLPQPRRPEAIPVPPTRGMAVRHQRMLFHEIALGWVAAYPRSPDAMEALAIALELLGDPAGLDTLRRARALATTDAGRVRTAAAEVWMRLRQSMPDDLEGLRLARALADSLLNRYPPPGAPEPQLLAGLAALGGRAALAVAYMRETAARQGTEVDAPIAGMAPALLMFAALGGPTDSLRRLEKAVADAIARMPPQERRSAKATWLARAASLAFPSYRFATLGELADIDDYLVDAQTAFARGDRAAARRMFAAEGARRRLTPPEDLTLDGVYPEAALLAEMGDTAGAIAWLDPTLNALSAAAPQLFNDPTRAGALVRAMALRAALARAAGDTAAAGRWERATLVLWNTPARAS